MKRGITLIQVIFFLSVLCFISSLIFQAVISGRANVNDKANRVLAQEVQKAIQRYILDQGRAPENFGYPGKPAYERDLPDGITGQNAYEKSMSVLVPHYLKSIPRSQGGNFAYYNYGPGNPMGALFVNNVKTQSPSVNGLPGSCRPFYQQTIKETVETTECSVSKSCYHPNDNSLDAYCVMNTVACKARTALSTGGVATSATKRHLPALVNWCTTGVVSSYDCFCSPYGS